MINYDNNNKEIFKKIITMDKRDNYELNLDVFFQYQVLY